jgi:hypothetical protein
MRSSFVRTLTELAARDPRVLLLTADLGYSALELFADEFPERFFNVGVAEQNMVGLATGLAEAGFLPFVYSIVPFAVLRPYEFIRNGPILHQLPVRIVGVGGGWPTEVTAYPITGWRTSACCACSQGLRSLLLPTANRRARRFWQLGICQVRSTIGSGKQMKP